MNFSERLTVLQTRIDALTLRERAILFFVILSLIYFVWSSLLVAPQEQEQKRLLAEIGQLRAEITTLEQQSLSIINRHNTDPNAAELKQLEQLERENTRLEQQLAQAVEGLIDPQQMAVALESVLKQQKNLSFVRIENLGATSLLSADSSEPSEQNSESRVGIYKHTMRIELEGSYHNTLSYLRALENLPWRFHWEAVEMNTLEYPVARVVITVNTLSLSEGWIGV